jgi:tetratricopeptide (TPR) repeat protein
MSSINPATIERPRFGDKAGLLFGLVKGSAAAEKHAAARASAEKLAGTDRAKAYQILERIERLLFWEKNCDRKLTHELEAAMVLHAALLSKDNKQGEAAALLLAARSQTTLKSSRNALEFLAVTLARSGDGSERSIEVYLDYLSVIDGARTAPSDVVGNMLVGLAIPHDRLAEPSGAQRSLTERIRTASPSYAPALFGTALCAYHAGKFKEAIEAAAAAKKAGAFHEHAAYIEHVCAGRLAASVGDTKEAIRRFENAHAAHAGHTAALVGLAEAALAHWDASRDRGQEGSAELSQILGKGKAAAENALTMSPESTGLLRVLGRICLVTDDLDRAADLLGQALRTAPDPEAAADLASVHLERGNHQAALKTASEAERRWPQHPGVLCSVGDVYSAAENWGKAAEAFLKANAAVPTHLPAAVGAGRALFMQGEVRKAAEVLGKAAESGSRPATYWYGRAQLRLGNPTAAVASLSSICRQNASFDEYYYAASALAQAGQPQEAIPLAKAAEELEPANPNVHLLSAKLYAASGQPEESSACLARTEELCPDHPELRYARACVAYARGDLDSAKPMLSDAASSDADSSRCALASAMVSLRMGDAKAAAECARKYLETEPNDYFARNVLAAALARQGEVAEAEKTLNWDDILLSGCSDAHLWISGNAAVERGEYEGALLEWQELAKRHPDLERLALNINRLHYLIGRRKLEEGDYAGAIAAWEQYAESRDEDEELQKDVAELHFRIGRQLLASSDESDLLKAKESLKEATKRSGGSDKVYFYRGLLDLRRGSNASAVQNLAKAAESGDSRFSETAALWSGLAMLHSGDPQGAAEGLERLSKNGCSEPVAVAARHALAVAYAQLGDWKQAAKLASDVDRKGGHADG